MWGGWVGAREETAGFISILEFNDSIVRKDRDRVAALQPYDSNFPRTSDLLLPSANVAEMIRRATSCLSFACRELPICATSPFLSCEDVIL
jgi:hypothetical protein